MEEKEEELLLLLKQCPEDGVSRLVEQYGAAVMVICRQILRGCGRVWQRMLHRNVFFVCGNM